MKTAVQKFGYFLFVCLMTFGMPSTGWAKLSFFGGRESPATSYAPIIKEVGPGVVNIYATHVVEVNQLSPLFSDPLLQHFFGDEFAPDTVQKKTQRSLGSGVIVRADGLVITNHHVIRHADSIKVVLADKREFPAEIIAVEHATDLALIRLKTKGETFKALELADVDSLEVGDLVLAIGNPFGIGQTVTTGIVSALARTQVGTNNFRTFIQTDAAINPGNSGGGLITLGGKLAGVNTAILSKSGGSIGLGFAIPANLVRAVIKSADRQGKILRPWASVAVQDVTPDISESLGLRRPTGVLVAKLFESGPAMRAGLKEGDLLVSLDGREIESSAEFYFRIASEDINNTVRLEVVRQGKRTPFDVVLKLEKPPETSVRPAQINGRHPLGGAKIVELSPGFSMRNGIDFMESGVIIIDLDPGSLAQRVGLVKGDIIKEVNGVIIETIADLSSILNRIGNSRKWQVKIKRGGKEYVQVFTLN
jgi:serine protease Do